ncbi:hypothetical protein Tco_1579391 [Tanacetum coccineum]
MFWHTAQDDTMFTSMRCISKHEDTQKTDSNTSPKKKPVQATKGARLKSKAKVAKPDKKKKYAKKTKAKGDGVDTQSKVLDEQQQKSSGTYEGTDKDNENNSDDLSDDGDNDDHDDDSDEERIKSDRDEIPDLKLTNVDQTEHEEEEYDDEFYKEEEDENIDDEENMDDEEDDEVIKELYDDVNVNLGNDDTEMTDADQGALEQQNVSQESRFEEEEEDAHVTLTSVIEAQKADEPVQSSYVSSDFISKLLNHENPSPADNEIASLLAT